MSGFDQLFRFFFFYPACCDDQLDADFKTAVTLILQQAHMAFDLRIDVNAFLFCDMFQCAAEARRVSRRKELFRICP